MPLQDPLDRFHARAVRLPWLRLLAAATRGLLAVGFVVPGLKKFGGRFTQIPISEPVGFFFEAMYQAHGFYLFIGAMQVLAGVLLLPPTTTLLGAVIYFPLILNIFIINVSVGFTGTYYITAMMLLGATFLLCWEYDRWRGMLPGFGASAAYDPARHLGAGYALIGGAALGVLGLGALALAISAVEGRPSVLPRAALLLAAGLALGAGVWTRARRAPAGAAR